MNNKISASSLRKIPLFEHLNDEGIHAVLNVAIEKTYKKGEVVIHQGDRSSEAFVVIYGCVRVYRTIESGNEISLAVLCNNELFGEMGLFDESSRSATVEAIKETKILAIKHEDLRKIICAYPDAGEELFNTLVRHLQESNKKLEEFVAGNLVARVWKALESLAEHYPRGEITLSHDELAKITGATRSRVTEALHELQQKHKLNISRRRISLI